MIAIINYGLGNSLSILNMLKHLGIEGVITNDAKTISNADKLLLPGVGNFKKGMENLHNSDLKVLLDDLVLIEGKPILGICLGAQLMTKQSEEGNVDGLGWIGASTVRFDQSKAQEIKVPHMGWSTITLTDDNPLWLHLPAQARFYFVHAYHFLFNEKSQVSATCTHGYDFVCAFKKNNIYGVQFHPEKSHTFGMTVLKNFNNI